MISIQEEKSRKILYDNSFEYLLNRHRKWPSIEEVCLYIATIKKEDIKNILELYKEKENERNR